MYGDVSSNNGVYGPFHFIIDENNHGNIYAGGDLRSIRLHYLPLRGACLPSFCMPSVPRNHKHIVDVARVGAGAWHLLLLICVL